MGHEYDGIASVDMTLLHSTDTFFISFEVKRDDEKWSSKKQLQLLRMELDICLYES